MFRVYFNRRKQWYDVVLHDVNPTTFQNRGGGRWGYYENNPDRDNRKGLFGTVHLVKSRVREDLVAHELFHLLCDWMRSRSMQLLPSNEERFAELMDSLVRGFYREYNKFDKAMEV